MGAKEQSGRTWPSIFWARGTPGNNLFNAEKCLGQHYAGSGAAKEEKHCQRHLIGSLQTNSGGKKINQEKFLLPFVRESASLLVVYGGCVYIH